MLTEAEKHVHDLLMEAYKAYHELPDHDSCDDSEACEAIHRFQNVIAIRSARRSDPGYWKVPDGGWARVHSYIGGVLAGERSGYVRREELVVNASGGLEWAAAAISS